LVLVLIKGSTICPHTSKNEETFIDEFDGVIVLVLSQFLEMLVLLLVVVELPVELIDDACKTLDALHITDWCDVRLGFEILSEALWEIVGKCKGKYILWKTILNLLILGQPRVIEWFWTNIRVIHEKHTTSGYCSWCGILKVGDFKNESHFWGHWNTLL
jgi:hypothetical protein